jgi:hypothetical protein
MFLKYLINIFRKECCYERMGVHRRWRKTERSGKCLKASLPSKEQESITHNRSGPTVSKSKWGGACMDYDPEFSKKSNTELNICLTKYTEEHEFYSRALSELSRREKSAEDKISASFSKAIFWSRLAALLALPGALFVVWYIVQSIH